MKGDKEVEYEFTLEDGETVSLKRKEVVNIVFVLLEIFAILIVISIGFTNGFNSMDAKQSDNYAVTSLDILYEAGSKHSILGNTGVSRHVVLQGDTMTYTLNYGEPTLGTGVTESIVPFEITNDETGKRYVLYGENILSADDALYVEVKSDFELSDVSADALDNTVYIGDNYLYFSEKC